MRFHNLDLNLLVVLDALIAEHSVSRAAERLNLTQPAISNALARLREHFQDDLLVRLGRTMAPTPLAESLRGPVRDALLHITSIVEARPGFDPSTAARTFTIVASDYVATTFLTEAVRRLNGSASGIRITTLPLTERNVARLDRGEADLLIIPQATELKAHPARHLFDERFTCIAWRDNADVPVQLSLKSYLARLHVVASFDDPNMEPFDATFLRERGQERRVAAVTPSFALLPFYVIGTPYIATLQARLARLAAETMPVRILQPRFELPVISEVLQWHRSRETDPAIMWLRDFLGDIAAAV